LLLPWNGLYARIDILDMVQKVGVTSKNNWATKCIFWGGNLEKSIRISTNILAFVLLCSDSLVLKSLIMDPIPNPLFLLREVFMVSLIDIFMEFLLLSIGSLPILIPVLNYSGSVLFLFFCCSLRKNCWILRAAELRMLMLCLDLYSPIKESVSSENSVLTFWNI